jgi:hypothetical protein
MRSLLAQYVGDVGSDGQFEDIIQQYYISKIVKWHKYISNLLVNKSHVQFLYQHLFCS